jgi:hypothetical protein
MGFDSKNYTMIDDRQIPGLLRIDSGMGRSERVPSTAPTARRGMTNQSFGSRNA